MGASDKMPGSWLKMIQNAVREGIDQHVSQAVQSAMSEITKEGSSPCSSLEISERLCSTLPTSPVRGKCIKKEIELLEQKTACVSSLDFSTHPQKECESMQLLSDSLSGIIAENSPWPTRPSAIRRSTSQVNSTPPQQSESNAFQGSHLSTIDGKLNQEEDTKTYLNQESTRKGQTQSHREEVRWSLALIYKGAASLGTETAQKQTSDESMQLLSGSLPGIIAESSPWPTRPSAIRKLTSSPSQKSERNTLQGSLLSTLEVKPNQEEEEERTNFNQESIEKRPETAATSTVEAKPNQGEEAGFEFFCRAALLGTKGNTEETK